MNAVAFNPVFLSGDNLQVGLHMKSRNKFPKQRVDVVNIVRDSGRLGNSPAFVVKTKYGSPIGPLRSSVPLGRTAPNVVLVAHRKTVLGGPKLPRKFIGRPAVAENALCGSGPSSLMFRSSGASVGSGSPGIHVRLPVGGVLSAPLLHVGPGLNRISTHRGILS